MYKRVLIVIDGRPVTPAAVDAGIAIAKTHGAEILLLHVLPRGTLPMLDMSPFGMVSPQDVQRDDKEEATKILSAAAVHAERAGVMARAATAEPEQGQDDARCVVEAARRRRCDLIVVASEGRSAMVRLLTGSIISGLITVSPLPVLVVKERERRQTGRRASAPPGPPRPLRGESRAIGETGVRRA